MQLVNSWGSCGLGSEERNAPALPEDLLPPGYQLATRWLLSHTGQPWASIVIVRLTVLQENAKLEILWIEIFLGLPE